MRSLTLALILALAAGSAGAKPAATVAAKHTVTASDTLWTLAQKYYGDADHWRRIYLANKASIKDPSKLEIGQVLVIPGTEKASLVPAEPLPDDKSEPSIPRLAPEPETPKAAPVTAPAQIEVPIPPAPKRRAAKAEAPKPSPKPQPAKLSKKELSELERAQAASPMDAAFDRLSKDFPPPLVSGDTQQTRFLPVDWKADGYVSPAGGEMAAVGDLVKIVPYSAEGEWKPGAKLMICRKGEKRRGKRPGIFVQRIGVAEVVSAKDGRIRAKVLKIWDAVLEGDVVKMR